MKNKIMEKKFWDFLLAFNTGLYVVFLTFWVSLTFWHYEIVVATVNAYLWGALLMIALFFIGLNIKLVFGSKNKVGESK